jgi:hypothetical protein
MPAAYTAAMKKRVIPSEADIQNTLVRLPVLFGKQPRQYIVAVWATGWALGLFLILILPGLLFPGSHVRIEADTPNGSVRVDGVRLGTSPLEIFLPSGPHTIEVMAPFLVAQPRKIDLPRQLVGSLVVLGRTTIHIDQTMTNQMDWAAATIAEFSRWSLTDIDAQEVPKKNYPLPPVLVPALETYAGLLKGATADSDFLLNLLRAAAVHLNNQPQAEDWAGAWQFLSARLRVKAATTATAVAIIGSLSAISRTDDVAKWVSAALDGHPAIAQTLTVTKTALLPAALGGSETIGGLHFVSYRIGQTTGYLAQNETDERTWGEFLKAHPEWAYESVTALVDQGLVDKSYLKTWVYDQAKNDLPIDKPVREVSYMAVEQFAKWFSDFRLPAGLRQAGYRAALPSYELWAALDAAMPATAYGPWLTKGQDFPLDYRSGYGGISAFRGGLFEWSADTASFNASSDPSVQAAVRLFPGIQRRLLGGAVTMEASEFDPAAVYGQPADWCSPYVGFRLVLVKDGS